MLDWNYFKKDASELMLQNIEKFEKSGATVEQLVKSVLSSKNAWSFASGYCLQDIDKNVLSNVPGVKDVHTQEEADRDAPGDHSFRYISEDGSVSHMIQEHKLGNVAKRKYDYVVVVIISHRDKGKEYPLPSGKLFKTNCIKVDEFDIFSMSYFDIDGSFKKKYCLTDNLPRYDPDPSNSSAAYEELSKMPSEDRDFIKKTFLKRSLRIDFSKDNYWSDNLQEVIKSCVMKRLNNKCEKETII